MAAKLEFIVNGFVIGFTNELRVIGRCGDLPIRIGDLFENLRDKIDGDKPISLKVVAIQAYGRELQEMGEGMTGTITVSGGGSDLLRPMSVLEGHGNKPSENTSATASMERA